MSTRDIDRARQIACRMPLDTDARNEQGQMRDAGQGGQDDEPTWTLATDLAGPDVLQDRLHVRTVQHAARFALCVSRTEVGMQRWGKQSGTIEDKT
jgi:hypothetical protein